MKPSRTGLLAITSHGYANLLSSSKKTLSIDNYVNYSSSYDSQKTVYYGVKKGKTYYVKVRGKGDYNTSSRTYVNGFRYVNKSYNSKFASSSKKAKILRSGKKYKGCLPHKSSAKYYKFRKTARKTRVYIKTYTDNRVKAVVKAKAPGYRALKQTMTFSRPGTERYVEFYNYKHKKLHYRITVKIYRDGKSSGAFQTWIK